MEKTLDCFGIDCPMPVIQAKNELEKNDEIILTVKVDNEEAKNNVTRLAKSKNLKVEYPVEKEGEYHVKITKTGKEKPLEHIIESNQMTVLITSKYMGVSDPEYFKEGNDILGTNLMKTFIYSLVQTNPLPKKIMFINSAVFLTTQNEEVIENLKILENEGTEIVSCGICLDYYGVKDDLKVGIIGNMYDIVDSLNHAKNKVVV